jgi:uncharacterized protein (TIRG00374 family)
MNSEKSWKQKMKRPAKSKIQSGLKILLVSALLYFLTKSNAISLGATLQALKQWNRMLAAFLVVVFCGFLGAIRWQWLLQGQGIHLRFRRTFQLAMIGNFFNIALPGAVSGDFVKAFYVAKEVEGRPSKAFGSILFDRVVGLSGLVIVAGAAMAFGYIYTGGSLAFGALGAFIKTAALVVLFFYSYLFFLNEKRDPMVFILSKLVQSIPKLSSFERIYLAIRYYHHHRLLVIRVLLISMFIHLGIGFALTQFVIALGEWQVSIIDLYSVFPSGMLVTALPIAPAGVGTGHAAFSYLFHLIGSKRGADVFSLYALMQFIMGGLGGLVYLQFKGTAAALKLDDSTD